MKVRLCFHGTPAANVPFILKDGLDPKRRKGQGGNIFRRWWWWW
jgi:hypothetical protein